ncbi:recombinase family protein [Marinisporobacter balticus]|uniref:Site-specific DNA recombinase n=1 Tax=Marinisporobacter balticus TaxID=2018667 RepID=A0A4R2L5D1_9FIRM|nr:recombinase family protein [Marinisporobacter balticus]TCO79086.1 site-specific DNA recombinase [Marinisporobacter balticus]
MKIAIYSRKSKFTGKGESMQNQIELCKEYAQKHFDNIEEFIVYEDEGFSGGNVDRPEYQNMIKHAGQGKFEVLMCYRLDRISRNISNFSDTIETLQSKDIAFISLREQFDTSTPMGRAMMYIASVFAQLERETIAERIRDNMMQLAKTGRWLGGMTPIGFESESVETTDQIGKQRKLYRLSPIPSELETVKIIYDKFLELKSLTKVETYCIQNNIKTRNNIDFTRFALRGILSNPVYATADKTLYNYLSTNGFELYADENDFNGQNGIMAYNKTIQKKNTANKVRDYSEWVISIGAHEGIISSEKWINAQKMISKNKSKTFRKVKNTQSLLSGLLRCENCNSFMRPKTGRIDKDGIQIFYYMCEMKEKSKKMKCDMKNINGNKLDKLVIEEIKKLSENNSTLDTKISTDKINIETADNNIKSQITMLENHIKNNERSIANLVDTLSQAQNSTATKYIISQIEALDQKTATLKDQLFELRERTECNQLKSNSLDIMNDMLTTFSNMIDSLDVYGKRNLLRTLVEKIIWDGENIDLVMFGVNTGKK